MSLSCWFVKGSRWEFRVAKLLLGILLRIKLHSRFIFWIDLLILLLFNKFFVLLLILIAFSIVLSDFNLLRKFSNSMVCLFKISNFISSKDILLLFLLSVLIYGVIIGIDSSDILNNFIPNLDN